MAINLGSGHSDELCENADINITPFIDVILVLLIIFMVAAPLSTVDVPVELPTSNAAVQPRPDKPIFISVKSDLALTLGETPVARSDIGAAIDVASKGNKDERVFLRADKGVSYGDLMQVMNLLRAAGYLKVGLVGVEDAADRGGS